MRTVVLYQLLSLDGVAEEPGDWFADDGPEMFENLRTVIERQATVLLGRGTYDYWVGLLADVRSRAVRPLHQRHRQARVHRASTVRCVAEHDVRHDLGRRSRRRDEAGRRR